MNSFLKQIHKKKYIYMSIYTPRSSEHSHLYDYGFEGMSN